MSFKMLLIAGHGKNTDGSYDPGAVGCGYKEAELTRELVKLIKASADKNSISCDVAPDRNYFNYFKNGGTYDFTPYNYVLEIHFNASSKTDYNGNGQLTGSMVYIHKDETGHSVENAILNNLYEIGSRQAWDGVVVAQRQWPSGLLVQNKVREQGVSHAVLETCFISDRDDVEWYLVNKSKIANAIINGVMKGFKLGKYHYIKPFVSYMVKVTDSALNIRSGAGTNYSIVGCITDKGCYTIIDEKNGTGASKWGKLKSGAGWISLDYCEKI